MTLYEGDPLLISGFSIQKLVMRSFDVFGISTNKLLNK